MVPVGSKRAAAPVATLVALALALAAPGSAEQWSFEGPGFHLDPQDGTAYLNRGFVGVLGDQRLIGDAVRYDMKRGLVWASGNVVFTRPGVRLAASRIGMRTNERTGRAWDVEATIETRGRTIRATAEEVVLEPTRIVLRRVRADLGHGGVLSYACPAIRIYLADGRDPDRGEIGQYVDGVDVLSPTVKALGVPVLWLPYLYRDFAHDYPWSRVLLGSSRRTGQYVHFWLGSNLPVVGGWHTRVEARGDRNTRAGNGYGAEATWRHDDFGDGGIQWFQMPRERVSGGIDDRDVVDVRDARVLDAEHQLNLGRGAAYARWTQLPGSEPLVPGQVPPAGGVYDRFRADYLEEDLDHRPFARRGGALSWGGTLGTVVVDAWKNPRREWTQSERQLGLHAELAPVQVAGPVHARLSLWEEDLHRIHDDTSADRFRGEATLGGTQWLGGVGLDAAAGARALRYDRGRLLGSRIEGGDQRAVGIGSAGLRLRLAAEGERWWHVLTPRVGVEATSDGRGDVLPAYGFGDRRDVLEEDRRYWVTGVETALTRGEQQLRLRAKARFAMRERDRLWINPVSGTAYRGDAALADVAATLEGESGPLSVTATGTWDQRPRRLLELNGQASVTLSRRVSARHVVFLLPETNRVANEPGMSFRADRYRVDAAVTLRPHGRPIDVWFLQLGREMVDGELTISYEYHTNAQGDLYDQRVGFGFTLFGTGSALGGRSGPGASYTMR